MEQDVSKRVGICGLYCGTCPSYLAFRKYDIEYIERLAIAKGVYYDALRCDGCLSDKVAEHCTDCRHGFIANGGPSASGITVINHNLIRNITGSEGHKLWTQGILFDNCKVTSVINPDSRTYTFFNRGDYGTSHGWGTVNSVVWNTDGSGGGEIVVQKPPTAQNYAIGCSGAVSGNGPFRAPAGFIEGTNEGNTLHPQSLYQAQLADRLEQPQRP